MDNRYNIGTPINNEYKVGDAVFIQHRTNNQPATTIGFLVSTVNRGDTILARTINPLSDFITISDNDFICLGHLERFNQ